MPSQSSLTKKNKQQQNKKVQSHLKGVTTEYSVLFYCSSYTVPPTLPSSVLEKFLYKPC